MKEKNWQYLIPAEIVNSDLPESLQENEVWKNDIYTVFVRRKQMFKGVPCSMTWLSIKRNDKEPCRDWRHFQWIKNQLCGAEKEGCELYPAESRLTDGSNQYHLWVLDDPKVKFQFGFTTQRNISRYPFQGGKQRQFPDNMLPKDINDCENRLEEMLKQYSLIQKLQK